jgi:glyoxylase-like metal-dependent hydrolase (beta-lactamase superfamily II)
MEVQLYPLLVGYFEATESDLFKGGNFQNKLLFASYVYYLKLYNKKIIVDTGIPVPQFCKAKLNYTCKLEEGMSLEERLKKHGVSLDAIDTIILTHCHWDHIGGLSLLPNAKIYCQREEISWAIAPPEWLASSYPKVLADLLLSVKERIELLDGDVLLEKGIYLRKVGGHSPGSQIVELKFNNKKVIITGDLLLYYDNLEKQIPIGVYHNLEKVTKILSLLRSYKLDDCIILPSHDPLVWEKYQSGICF